jgi:GTPase SAR1 family protein
LQDWVVELKNNAPKDLVLAVCGNKSDLELDRCVERSTAEEYSRDVGAAIYIEASAKNGDQVQRLFEDVAKAVPAVETAHCNLEEEEEGLDLSKSSQPSSSCC